MEAMGRPCDDQVHLPACEALGLSATRIAGSAMQARLERMPDAMTIRRRTAEHPFGTIKTWMGATHFLTRSLTKVKTEMSLNVLAYNLKRMIALFGVGPLIQAMAA